MHILKSRSHQHKNGKVKQKENGKSNAHSSATNFVYGLMTLCISQPMYYQMVQLPITEWIKNDVERSSYGLILTNNLALLGRAEDNHVQR